VQFGKVRTPETDPVRLSACRDLLATQGPYLHGDAEGQGARQVTAIESISAELDAICDAFGASIAAGNAPELAAMAEPLWSILDLCGQYKLLHQLADALGDCSERLDDQGLHLLAQLGAAQAMRRLGQHYQALDCAQSALELAQRQQRRDLRMSAIRLVGQCAITLGQT
jgi:hypothetical protein